MHRPAAQHIGARSSALCNAVCMLSPHARVICSVLCSCDCKDPVTQRLTSEVFLQGTCSPMISTRDRFYASP